MLCPPELTLQPCKDCVAVVDVGVRTTSVTLDVLRDGPYEGSCVLIGESNAVAGAVGVVRQYELDANFTRIERGREACNEFRFA